MVEIRKYSYPITILESLLDSYGHVNNAAYISLFEQARWEIITAAGCGLDYIKESGIGPVVLEIQTKFSKEIRLRQKVVIESQMEPWQGKIGAMTQVIIDESGATCCVAKFKFGLFDLKTRKLILPTETWIKALGIHYENSEA